MRTPILVLLALVMGLASATSGAGKPTKYTLTVNNGTGDGDYTADTVVDIGADTAPSGQEFDDWVGDTSGIYDVEDPTTTLTMPTASQEVTATYANLPTYTLTVNSGTGDGSYIEGTAVEIAAEVAPSGYGFDEWVGDTSGIADVEDPTTTITMPAAATEVTATYVEVSGYLLTVEGGSGDGYYDESTVVNVGADSPPSGMLFYKWSGDVEYVADVYDEDTTVTMPASEVTVTAVFSEYEYDTIHFREGGDAIYTDVDFDDTYIDVNSATDSTYGDLGYNGLQIADQRGAPTKIVLTAIKDMFTELPAASGGNAIIIKEAILYLTRYNSGDLGQEISFSRVLTDWLPDEAGTNENDVSGMHAEVSIATDWSTGDFDDADHDGANAVIDTITNDAYEGTNGFDVTSVIQDIYDSGSNYGLAMIAAGRGDSAIFRASEHAVVDSRPSLEILYTYGLEPKPTYCLTVNSGDGDGEYWEGQEVEISADTPPSGTQFNMWIGGGNQYEDKFSADTTFTMPDNALAITATYDEMGPPVNWWPGFNVFCKETFGAEKEALTYEMWGNTLQFLTDTDSEWSYISETSACLCFETNLPATTYIEYGETTSYGSQVVIETDRHYYLHVGYLTGLSTDTLYHYRYVAKDERDNIVTSSDKTFTTATPANVVYISTAGTLNQAGKTYVLTQDLVVDYGTAFEITADNVTLDLGGHTVVYNNVDDQVAGDQSTDYVAYSAFGVKAAYRTGVKIFNGTLKQGAGLNDACSVSVGYSPIYLQTSSGEVAGVTAEYRGSQMQGLHLRWSTGVTPHHNVVTDCGEEMVDREAMVHAMTGMQVAYHNLIKRARQTGIGTVGSGDCYGNEIYVDSVATNSYDILYYNDASCHAYKNRIFGTGYLCVGIGTVSGSTDVEVDENFVHLYAAEPDDRWDEYGAQSGAYCCRITWGGDNLDYHDNVMVTYARDGGMVRGTWFYTQSSTTDVHFYDNIVKAVLENEESVIQGCIVVAGDGSTSAPAHVYENNRIISNCCNVKFGESYGVGSNTRFYDNTFVKEGPARDDYRTIECGYSDTASQNHELYDSLFESGAGYDEVLFSGSGTRDFYVGWTLSVETESYANVTVEDVTQTQVFSGQADEFGDASVRLFEYKEDPSGKTYHTPHKVTAEKDSNSDYQYVTMDAKKTVQIPLP